MARPHNEGDGAGNGHDSQGPQRQVQRRRVPTVEETRQEGQELFQHFLGHSLRNQGISDPSSIIYDDSSSSQPNFSQASSSPSAPARQRFNQGHYFNGYVAEHDSGSIQQFSNPQWSFIAKNMDTLMNDFARSPHRREVERQANLVDVQNITREDFVQFLVQYFGSGRNLQLRIIGLFFLCSDIIYRAAKDVAAELGRKFVAWSLNFIREKITTWVLESGGWAEVFKVHGTTMIISLLFGAVGMALCLFLAKWWKK